MPNFSIHPRVVTRLSMICSNRDSGWPNGWQWEVKISLRLSGDNAWHARQWAKHALETHTYTLKRKHTSWLIVRKSCILCTCVHMSVCTIWVCWSRSDADDDGDDYDGHDVGEWSLRWYSVLWISTDTHTHIHTAHTKTDEHGPSRWRFWRIAAFRLLHVWRYVATDTLKMHRVQFAIYIFDRERQIERERERDISQMRWRNVQLAVSEFVGL